ncbi:hypothetical protein PO909_012606, partial [Leuciscus waleckii]
MRCVSQSEAVRAGGVMEGLRRAGGVMEGLRRAGGVMEGLRRAGGVMEGLRRAGGVMEGLRRAGGVVEVSSMAPSPGFSSGLLILSAHTSLLTFQILQ